MFGKRVHDELQTKSEILDTILNCIRGNNAKANSDLLKIIRDGASTEDIAQLASDMTQRTGSISKRNRPSVMDIGALTNQPIVQVPARPWTQVTNDNFVASHLMSAYLTWQHTTYPAIDVPIFIREIKKKQPSRFCSQFLMNALLAVACYYTDHPAAFAEPGDLSSRSLHFFEEATKLWEREEGSPTLTNLQGLTILIVCVVFMGKDRLALLYGAQLNVLRTDLFHQIRRARKAGSDQYADEEFSRSWRYAAWASFKIEVEMSMAWRTSFEIKKPTIPRPMSNYDVEARDTWRPYPKDGPGMKYNLYRVDDAGFSLYEIGADMCSILLSGNPQDSPLPGHIILEPSERLAQAKTIESSLLAWQDEHLSYPAPFDEMAISYLPGPIVELQFVYNNWRIEVNGIISHEEAASLTDREIARGKIIAACKRIANLLRYALSTFGFLNYPCHTMHVASVCAHKLIDELDQRDIPDVFHVMIVTLTAICQRITLARGITRALWMTITERKLERYILDATISLLKLNAVENWGIKDHELFIGCSYPNYATSSNNGGDLHAVGDLLASYAKLDISTSEPETSDQHSGTSRR